MIKMRILHIQKKWKIKEEQIMNLTKAEAINLILGFYTNSSKYWIDIKYEIPELEKFIKAGCTTIDEENKHKIIPNQHGKEVLELYYVEISKEFIGFMIRKNNMECSVDEVVKWFVDSYNLSDVEIGEDICFYIAKKIDKFGYVSDFRESTRNQRKFRLIKNY